MKIRVAGLVNQGTGAIWQRTGPGETGSGAGVGAPEPGRTAAMAGLRVPCGWSGRSRSVCSAWNRASDSSACRWPSAARSPGSPSTVSSAALRRLLRLRPARSDRAPRLAAGGRATRQNSTRNLGVKVTAVGRIAAILSTR